MSKVEIFGIRPYFPDNKVYKVEEETAQKLIDSGKAFESEPEPIHKVYNPEKETKVVTPKTRKKTAK